MTILTFGFAAGSGLHDRLIATNLSASKEAHAVSQIVPSALLFDYRVQIPACPQPSRRKKGRLLTLTDQARLPAFSAMDGSPSFATVSLGWNSQGFGISVAVRGRNKPVNGNPLQIERSDCLEIWIDTRPTGNVHRATGYCHRVACLPVDESSDSQPSAIPVPIAQQREIRAEMQAQHIQLRTHLTKDGYDMETWIPDSQLYGYRQVDELRQLGFYCVVRDTELGEQPLTLTDDFPFAWDPALWVQLELIDS